jgi:hypothetical protein
MTKTMLLFASLITLAMGAGLPSQSLWKSWRGELRRQCHANHVEWIGDGRYDDLLSGFVHTLQLPTQRRIAVIADYSHRCSEEKAGFSCEMLVHLEAFNRLGLLKQFSAFGCHRYKCEELALCVSIEP